MRWIPLLLLIALSACGQAGELYLPENAPEQGEAVDGDTDEDDENEGSE